MGKRIIQRARGHGSLTYRVRKRAYRYKIRYPPASGEGTVIELLNSPAHSAPLAKIKINEEIFYNPACNGMIEGQKIKICVGESGRGEEGKEGEKDEGKKDGDIAQLKDLNVGMKIYNIEIHPNDGGKAIHTAGSFATIVKKFQDAVAVSMPSRKEIRFDLKCRATIGVIAGAGRFEKPIVKAGKMHHMMKARNKLWPRTSAVKMNIVDHPFGSGRGKRIKSKIAKRNAPPGAKVGHIRPRQVGKRR